MKITVIGTGYLGAVHAAGMASLGHDVVGVDTDSMKVEALNRGKAFFHEPGLDELLERGVRSGYLRFSTSIRDAADHAKVHFLAVGSPQEEGSYRADTTYLDAVIDGIVPLLSEHHLLIGKSTVPVGTARRLQRRADRILRKMSSDATVTVCWNPEFLREGQAVEGTLHPDRIVLGLPDMPGPVHNAVDTTLREVYAVPLGQSAARDPIPVLVTDLETAELVKVSANAFLAMKISYINAVSEVCEVSGADVTVLARAIGLDDRIGPKFLQAGLGFGGGCLPKDIHAFMARAGELGADDAQMLLRQVDRINMRRREKMVARVRESFGGSMLGHPVTVLGAAFKPDSDDVRDSPALSVAEALRADGARVTVYDPVAVENARRIFPQLHYAPTLEGALEGADALVVATDWREFREMDPVASRRRVARPVVFDGRNCLPTDDWTAAGWDVRRIGQCPSRHGDGRVVN
ncbi:UDP-glucose/GDP-mannose dehydrogenase family protein [Corynebacterium sp.]|uniref:UDP-glucose dehydrogenase family protein n=2 Tax=Corynebacterium sp. TaxID=1720 RepID=UPI0026470CE3|nr:UDP-glucose/GDP-mannose dehydrogenase family protein [Corynebacterium sp.]MDN5721512.1 UDP-glucose/GDP-mannose dehydrogenase family protein [Corynebacterium sp.]MDN6281644.1 UDP-glucose/GDP-mannose dehydrogenase family protein [Corynebacterium sp.]MDN6352962.1 UDP-glucose/GDP-mannose dehydrogenase family protein [Corynebacterium sp.]MDN6367327.1 UDP-glucose/GDP-mannose dehydrogenase family protein [Corynebacterium sp.]MDN6374854.1 UDP-glucose/GDP-mannose dehydrogenase family protein [Coryne